MTTDGRPESADWSQLTSAQELLWASQQLRPSVPVYNMAFLYELHGPIDERAFVQAFDGLLTESDALRSVVHSVDGTPRQRVLPAIDFVLPVIDLDEANATEWAQVRCQEPLAIEHRTFDSALLRMAGGHYAWYLNQHHIVTDAWSFTVLYHRMEELYQGAREQRKPPGQPIVPFSRYLDFERRNRQSDTPPAANGQSAPPTALYGRRPPEAGTGNERITAPLGRAQSEALRSLAGRPGVRALTPDLGLFHLFATAWFAYLYRVSGQSKITIGAPAHNRVSAEFKRSAGLFMEMYPLHLAVEEDDTFETLHAKVRRATDAFIRSARPGGSDAAVNRNINTVLNYIRGTYGTFDGIPVRAEWLHPGHVDAEHHIRLQIHDFDDTGTFQLLFDCNRDVLDQQTRRSAADHFVAVLEAMTTGWDQPLAGIDLLARSGEPPTLAGPGLPAPANVVGEFRARAAEAPGALAITDGERSLTYGELDAATSRLAAGIAPGSTVGVCLPRSIDAVVAMIATLKAGASYVPLDPDWPQSRVQFVVADAGCAVVIADTPLELDEPTIPLSQLEHATERSPEPAIGPDDLAYVLYTSGSTGRPKGVMIEHGSLAHYVGWARDFYDRGRALTFPLFSPLTFDLTVTSIFVPLTAGGTVRVYGHSGAEADLAVQQVFEDDAVDIVKLTPSHLALVPERDLTTARIGQLILGGEDLTTAAARRVFERFAGDVEIHNEYGPTEATVGCIVHTFQPDLDRGSSVPIGTPIANMRAYIVDAAGRPVPAGVPGELWVAGAGLARGYVGRPDLTADRFAPGIGLDEDRLYRTGDRARARHDGTIEYLGRSDDQVKIRGARVELGEVEAALAAHPDVETAAARVWQRTFDDEPQLVFCSRCGLASNYPGASFDAERVCNQCRAYDTYRDKADVYFKPIEELDARLRQSNPDSDYDCLALLSGGKDSTYVLCRLVDMGLRVLAFTLDNGYISDQAKGNITRVVQELGVDHVFASTPAMNEIFVDSLQRHGNVCNGCFKTIYTLSLQTARERKIRHIVTGLSRGQFFETRLTEDLFTQLTVSSDEIDANVLETRKAYHQVDDAVHRLLDVSIFEGDTIFDEVEFVDFYRYCEVGLDELYAYLDERVPWVRPADTGRSTNCRINDVGIYYHRKTRGFHNYALPYSWDVRMGHKTRQQALDELDDDIDVAEVQQILHEIGYPQDLTEIESGVRLVGYYTATADIPVGEIRAHLSTVLPSQLIPANFVRLDSIPLTENGKIDRAGLPEPDNVRPPVDTVFLAPRTSTETALTRIWEAVLGITGIGIRDSFFDLGGDSIKAIQIVARAQRDGLPITLHTLFEALTVEELARQTEVADAAPPGDDRAGDLEAFALTSDGELGKLASLLGDRRDDR